MPDPAPATMSSGPSVCRTASAWIGFRCSSSGDPGDIGTPSYGRPPTPKSRARDLRHSGRDRRSGRRRELAPRPAAGDPAPARPRAPGGRAAVHRRRRRARRLRLVAAVGHRASRPGRPRTSSGRSSSGAWRPSAPQEAPPRVANVPGDAIAIIKIPKIHVDLVVVEGTDTESLKKGPGHYLGTAYPWQDRGRVGIAGHRTTYGAPFWDLNELDPATGSSSPPSTGSSTTASPARGSSTPPTAPSWTPPSGRRSSSPRATRGSRPRERLVVFADRVSQL